MSKDLQPKSAAHNHLELWNWAARSSILCISVARSMKRNSVVLPHNSRAPPGGQPIAITLTTDRLEDAGPFGDLTVDEGGQGFG